MDHTTDESTVKLCECGCGRPAQIAKKTSSKLGHIKGQPTRFIRGHARAVFPEKIGPAPSGLCECGCGQKTKIAEYTYAKQGVFKGQPNRFLVGHNANASHPKLGPNPSGLCLCGCGQETPIAPHSRTREGHVKGYPISYISGHHRRRNAVDCFWDKVEKHDDGCWIWTGSKSGKGYGAFNIDGKHVAAHRFSYELHIGPIPDGLFVCHNCPDGDNPACVNPAHLWLGTNQDNMQDMVNKGRAKSGGAHGAQLKQSKLRDDDASKIRQLYATGTIAQSALAKHFGVSQSVINSVVRRKTWKHVE